MIPKRFEEITEDDLAALIVNQVREGRTIDYKRELPAGNDASKKEFLADVSSFANTGGGDLIFGMEEVEALPSEIVGVQSGDMDRERQRLESIMASGLEPRIRYEVRDVECNGGRRVLILRIERSWSGPHRVVFQQSDRFWGRNSSGKYPLDVNELRSAFTLSSSVMERIRGFRTDRIIAISNNETPVPMNLGPKAILHCVPVESFATQASYDVIQYRDKPMNLPTLGRGGWSRRLTLEGLVVTDGDRSYIGETYTHLFRNGIFEVVCGPGWAIESEGARRIASVRYEKSLLDYLPICFRVYSEIGVNTPVIVGLAMTNVRGLFMWDPSAFSPISFPVDREVLFLPEAVIEDFGVAPGKILKPMFDLVWNACGQTQSKNFDKEGNWVERRY